MTFKVNIFSKYFSELSLKINDPIRVCYQNEKKCDTEVRRLVTETETLSTLAADWSTKLAEFDSALRDLGDVEAYSYAIERETNVLINATKAILFKNRNLESNSENNSGE